MPSDQNPKTAKQAANPKRNPSAQGPQPGSTNPANPARTAAIAGQNYGPRAGLADAQGAATPQPEVNRGPVYAGNPPHVAPPVPQNRTPTPPPQLRDYVSSNMHQRQEYWGLGGSPSYIRGPPSSGAAAMQAYIDSLNLPDTK